MALDPNRWTLKTQEALQEASRLAESGHHSEVTPAHLLLAALGQDGGVTVPILDRLGVPPLAVRNELTDQLSKIPQAYGGGRPELSRALLAAFERADVAQK